MAYADFVTAMMALFLCLWIVGQDQKIREAVERAFRQPYAVGKDSPSSLISKPGKDNQPPKSSSQGAFQNAAAIELAMAMLRQVGQDLMRKINDHPEAMDETVKMEFLTDGLKISVFDRARRPIFEPDSVRMTAYGDWVFSTLAWTITRYGDLGLELEGHTEQGSILAQPDYGAWELSTDRANVARRKLLEHGVLEKQVRKVAGFGDTQPMPSSEPTSEVNRRVVVMLKVSNDRRL